jgi:hypothetical protein
MLELWRRMEEGDLAVCEHLSSPRPAVWAAWIPDELLCVDCHLSEQTRFRDSDLLYRCNACGRVSRQTGVYSVHVTGGAVMCVLGLCPSCHDELITDLETRGDATAQPLADDSPILAGAATTEAQTAHAETDRPTWPAPHQARGADRRRMFSVRTHSLIANAREHALVTTLLALTMLALLFVVLPEQLGDWPYNVF